MTVTIPLRGKDVESKSLTETLNAMTPNTHYTAQEIAGTLGISPSLAANRLAKLQRMGLIASEHYNRRLRYFR